MWQNIAIQVGVSLVNAAANLLLKDKRERKKQAPRYTQLDQSRVPVVDEASTIPVVFGTVDLTGPNVVDYVEREPVTTPGGTQRKRTLYLYVWCHGPVDEVKRIRYGDQKMRSPTSSDPVFDHATSGSVLEDLLYVGDSGRGDSDPDQAGDIIFESYDGEQGTYSTRYTQALQSLQTVASQVEYRGLLSSVATVYWDTQQPKPLKIRVKRTLARSHGASPWYPSKAEVGDGMNPAHIIREARTNTEWGQGLDSSEIDDASFQAAADTLHAEGIGLSAVLTEETSIGDFEAEVHRHAGSLTYVDPTTGKLVMKLIRGGDSSSAVLDDSNIIEVTSFTRPSSQEIPTQVDTIYRGEDVDRDRALQVHNTAAALSRQSAATTQRYPMTRKPDIIEKLATRDMIEATRPLARVGLRVQRSAGKDLRPGDLVTYSDSDAGISSMSLRVASIDFGPAGDSAVELQCVQDAFGFGESAYADPEDSEWEDPTNPPQDPDDAFGMQVPLWMQWEYLTEVTPFGTAPGDYASQEDVLVAMVAEQPTTDSTGYKMRVDTETRTSSSPWSRRLQVTSDVPQAFTSTIDYAPTGLLSESDEYVGLLDDGSKSELVRCTNLDETAGTMDLERGLYDDRPSDEDYPAGCNLWILGRIDEYSGELHVDRQYALDPFRDYASGQTLTLRALTTTSVGTLDPSVATGYDVTTAKRVRRPMCPARLEISESGTDTDITWQHRERITRSPLTEADDNSGLTPDTDEKYHLTIKGEYGTVLRTVETTGTSYAYSNADEKSDSGKSRLETHLTIEIYAWDTTTGTSSTGLKSRSTYVSVLSRQEWREWESTEYAVDFRALTVGGQQQLWKDTAALTPVTSSGDVIRAVTDENGNKILWQLESTNAPTWGGSSVGAELDASSEDHLESPDSPGAWLPETGDFTILAVVTSDSTSPAHWASQYTSSTTDGRVSFGIHGDPDHFFFVGEADGATDVALEPATSISTGTEYRVAYRRDGDDFEAVLYDTQTDSQTLTGASLDQDQFHVGIIGDTGASDGFQGWDGDIQAVVVASEAWTDSEIKQVFDSLT